MYGMSRALKQALNRGFFRLLCQREESGMKCKRGRPKKIHYTPAWLKPEQDQVIEIPKEVAPDPNAAVVGVHRIIGECESCRTRGGARMVEFSDNTILIKCEHCGAYNHFHRVQHQPSRFDAMIYRPSPFDEDEIDVWTRAVRDGFSKPS